MSHIETMHPRHELDFLNLAADSSMILKALGHYWKFNVKDSCTLQVHSMDMYFWVRVEYSLNCYDP